MNKINLTSLIDQLMDDQMSYKDHCAMLDQFVEYCAFITNISADVTFDAFAEDTHLPSGMAINPQAAAMCVTDYRRTLGFIRAVHDAVECLLKTKNTESLNVLYAGCGPYATLMLAVIAKFQHHNITFHLLDIHQSALDSVQILLRHFDLERDKTHFYCEDACVYQPSITFHLIVAETMQKALEQEPQFQLTANLKQYVSPGGVFIPEAINLQLALIHWKQELDVSMQNKANLKTTSAQNFDRILVGKTLSLSKDSASMWLSKKTDQAPTPFLDFEQFETTLFSENKTYDFVMLTQIQLFQTICLEEYDSDLTLPTKLHEASPAKPLAKYHLKYELGSYPRFELSLIS